MLGFFSTSASDLWSRIAHRASSLAVPLLLLLIVAGTAGTVWNQHRQTATLCREFPLQGTALQVDMVRELRRIYSTQVVARVVRQGIEVTHDPDGCANAIPLPATLTNELGRALSEFRPGAHLRLYSDYPFPWTRDGGPRDEFDREALRALRENPDQAFYRFEDFEGRSSLRYAVADRMQANCVACHNSHSASPKKDWRVGDVRGVLEFIRPLDAQVAQGVFAYRWGLVLTVTTSSIGLVGLIFVYCRLRSSAKALAVGAAQTQAILISALDCIITIDHRGHVLEFNPAAEKTFGYSRADAIGRNLSELIVPPASREAHRRGLARFLATGSGTVLGKRIEVSAQRADGTEFPVELAINVIEQSGPPVFTAYLRDLTERRRAQDELHAVQSQNLDAARRAGMAEIATGVLHNVGNVLNSINVSASIVADKLRRSGVADLKSATELLKQHLDDPGAFLSSDSRGKHFPRFLIQLSQKMTSEEELILDEIKSLSKSVEHIKDIVTVQQSYAGGRGFVEELVMQDVVDDAIRMNAESIARHNIELVREYEMLPGILADKQKVLQILVNLFSNAKNAVVEPGARDPRIVVRLRRTGTDRLRIEVVDNGAGISPENLTRIFTHGFTTRKNGHGFGLHSAANLAREMGGNLSVHSDGPGAGAAFTFELPLQISRTQPCQTAAP